MTVIDLKILDNEPEALAKITQALSQVYFDNVLKKGYNIEPINEAYSIAFRLCPNYRLLLKESELSKKYDTVRKFPHFAEITSLPITPKQIK